MSDLSEFEHLDEVARLRQTAETLQKQLREAKDRSAALVDAVVRAAGDAATLVAPSMRVEPPAADRRRKDAEVAVWHLTDWQGGKVTTTYNSQVMRARVTKFLEKARRLTEIQRADHPVRKCVILFGGDMGEGLFNFPTQPFEIDATIFEQYVAVSVLVKEAVLFALGLYESVEVVAEWGNHGRVGSKRAVVPRSDNFDRMIYELARQTVGDDERLVWKDCPDDIQKVEIGNYRALLCHGDEVGRNGYVSPSQFQNHANKWRGGGFDWPFQDVYVGHYHRHGQEPLADGLGAIYWTGSTESDNRYARDNLGVTGVPSQRINFVDPERGRVTASYQVWLD